MEKIEKVEITRDIYHAICTVSRNEQETGALFLAIMRFVFFGQNKQSELERLTGEQYCVYNLTSQLIIERNREV